MQINESRQITKRRQISQSRQVCQEGNTPGGYYWKFSVGVCRPVLKIGSYINSYDLSTETSLKN